MIRALLVSLGLLLLVLTSCRQAPAAATGTLQIALTTISSPPVGESDLTVTVLDAPGRPVQEATVTVHGDMTHAGMMPSDGIGEETAPGVYRVPFDFHMGGDWILDVSVTLPDGASQTATFNLVVSSS